MYLNIGMYCFMQAYFENEITMYFFAIFICISEVSFS